MQFCIYYCAPDMQYINEAQQISFLYKPQDDTIEEFIKRHDTQHHYILMGEPFNATNIARLKALKEQSDNWTLVVSGDMDLESNFVKMVKDIAPRFMFGTPAAEWYQLQTMLQCGVSEVIITGFLGFCMPDVRKECNKFGTKIRVIANFASATWFSCPAIKKFFIRPEDVKYYANYADTIEFEGDKNLQEVCYRAYTKGEWFGDLSEIIINLNDELDSRRLPRNFGELRTKCHMRCICGGQCGVCRSMIDFAKIMEKTDTIINSGV